MLENQNKSNIFIVLLSSPPPQKKRIHFFQKPRSKIKKKQQIFKLHVGNI